MVASLARREPFIEGRPLSETTPNRPSLDVEAAVGTRYSAASQKAEAALCCAVNYDQQFLKVLPRELIERDYGCGNPAKYVSRGETVLDLGSGGGKICYIASQVVGPEGRVIGVDMNDDMLGLARQYQSQIAENIGWDNVSFFKGKIQDLALDLDKFESHLSDNPVSSANDWLAASQHANQMRAKTPMVESDSVDVVISNCVLNLVNPIDREQLFSELFRVLRHGGRAVISDIVANRPIPQALRDDPQLWSGCISGAYVESEFLQAFERHGFYAVEMLERQTEPWQTIEGIEFRSVTVRAFKCQVDSNTSDHQPAVVAYRGPWKYVRDETGHEYERGVWTTVSAAQKVALAAGPHASHFSGLGETVSDSGQPSNSSLSQPLNVVTPGCCDGDDCC